MCLAVKKVRNHDDFLEARPVKNGSLDNKKLLESDFLAQSTQYTKSSFEILLSGLARVQKTAAYKILTRTTQPTHVASIMLVLVISFCLWPELHQNQGQSEKTVKPLTTFVYLGSFATHFGAQMWMTFVSGLALYFSLPRHTFGVCQEILFPKYFLMNAFLSSVTLITFAKVSKNFADLRWIQLIILSACVIIEGVIYLYLTPSLLQLMRAKYQFERRIGTGKEVGYQKAVDGQQFPHHQQINQKFRKVHMMCAMGNVIAICCSFSHLFYLASTITIH